MASADLPLGTSATHQHLFAIIETMLARRLPGASGTIRILDIGCGDGRLMSHLHGAARRRFPELQVEVFGFDVEEQGYGDAREEGEAIDLLTRTHPEVPWQDRVARVGDGASWPYPPASFDFAVSNLVLEHVGDLCGLLENIRRVVRPDGASIHVVPLADSIIEGHVGVPFAHWIRNFPSRVRYLEAAGRLGIGRYRRDQTVLGATSRHEHAEADARYIQRWTAYRSFAEIADACYDRGLSVSYDFTKDLYRTKLRRLLGWGEARGYRRSVLPGGEGLAFFILKYLSAVTLTIAPVDYDISGRVRAEKAFRRRAAAGAAAASTDASSL